MRKLSEKRKSVSMMVLNVLRGDDDEESDAVRPLQPSVPGRRRSVFGLLGQPKPPVVKEKRRFSITAAFIGTPAVQKEEFFPDTPEESNSVDILMDSPDESHDYIRFSSMVTTIITIRGRSKSRTRAKKLLASISQENKVYREDNEVDYLPGLAPLSDEISTSLCFADGWDHRIVFNTANPKYAFGRRNESVELMGRAMRVVVCGARRVGKTAVLKQVACVEDITSQQYEPTIDDTYQVLLEEADRPREILIFHDTGGIPDYGPVELKKAYLQVADAFVLVYSVADHESFNRVDLLRKYIEQHHSKEKKEVPIVVLGNMKDQANRKVDSDFAHAWAAKAKVKLFEVSAADRNSLVPFVHHLGQRHFHPIKESKFSLSKKLKSEKSNAAILMDF